MGSSTIIEFGTSTLEVVQNQTEILNATVFALGLLIFLVSLKLGFDSIYG